MNEYTVRILYHKSQQSNVSCRCKSCIFRESSLLNMFSSQIKNFRQFGHVFLLTPIQLYSVYIIPRQHLFEDYFFFNLCQFTNRLIDKIIFLFHYLSIQSFMFTQYKYMCLLYNYSKHQVFTQFKLTNLESYKIWVIIQERY